MDSRVKPGNDEGMKVIGKWQTLEIGITPLSHSSFPGLTRESMPYQLKPPPALQDQAKATATNTQGPRAGC